MKLGTAFSVGSTLVSGVHGYMSYQAQAQAAEATAKREAQLARINADVASENASRIHEDARYNAGLQRRQFAMARGKLRTQMASSGVMLGSGTAGDVMDDLILQEELAVNDTLRQAQYQAGNYSNQASTLRSSADFIREQGKAQARSLRTSGYNSLFTSALTAGAIGFSGRSEYLKFIDERNSYGSTNQLRPQGT